MPSEEAMSVGLPVLIDRAVRRYVRRRRRIALVRALGRSACAALAWVLIWCLLDRWLRLSDGVRAAAGVAGVLICLGIPSPALWRFVWRGFDWRLAAAQADSAAGTFGGRLATVVSQWLEPRNWRGSEEMLGQLMRQVLQEVEARDPARFASWRPVGPPWYLTAGLALVLWGLSLIPRLGMPRLMERLFRPFAGVPPVTTTRIELAPGDLSIRQGSPLVISARVANLPRGSVDILTSPDGHSWSRMGMLPDPDGQYLFRLGSVEHDFYYQVEAGDARTGRCRVTVLRPPAIVGYRFRLLYPGYTGRPALMVENTDGQLDALNGTEVELALTASVELVGARLTLDGQVLDLKTDQTRRVWRGRFLVQRTATGRIELIGAGDMRTVVPDAVRIRVESDREPLVRLLEPGQDLRLHAREIIAVRYEAMDDYGIAEIKATVEVGGLPPLEIPLTVHGDSRRVEDEASLDLARLDVDVGDVVRLWMTARDGAGQVSRSHAREILISPRSIAPAAHWRIAELKEAAALASAAEQELQGAAEACDAAARSGAGSPEQVAAATRLGGRLAGAAEAALMLHQALLRACARSASPQQTLMLADAVDRARVQAVACERTAGVYLRQEGIDRRVSELLSWSRRLARDLRTVSEGEQAWAILADKANIEAMSGHLPRGQAAPIRQESLQRAREEIAAAVSRIGLKPQMPDLEQRLRRRVEAADQLVRSAKAIDFAAEAARWSAAVLRGQEQVPPLPERLLSAASVEAVRPDADPIIAHDLQVASRASAAIQAAMDELRSLPVEGDVAPASELEQALREFPGLLGVLMREHELRRQSAATRPATVPAAGGIAEVQARARLTGWARGFWSGQGAAESAPEDLALQASAQTASRDYSAARRSDQSLIEAARKQGGGQAGDAEKLSSSLTRVEGIDRAAQQQDSLTRETGLLDQGHMVAAEHLAERQREVAEEILPVHETDDLRAGLAANADARRRASEAIQESQAELLRLPQQLTVALQASQRHRRALLQAEEARRVAASASGADLDTAQLVAERAARALWEARELLDAACRPLQVEAWDRMAKRLEPFWPETMAAVEAITQELSPAIQSLEQVLQGGDASAADRAAARVRSAIEVVQLQLRQAQAAIIESDPLVMARWFAESAAQSLAKHPPDVGAARGAQDTVAMALGRAWQGAVRELTTTRLLLTRSFQPVLGGPAARAGFRPDRPATVRSWTIQRSLDTDMLGPTPRELTPAGYEDALRVYFEYLGKTQWGVGGP